MGFFDLNIPYLETTKPIPQNQTLKHTRLKLTIKTMELGYTGIAYNRTIKGVMSDSDYRSIPLFSISSLLKLSPYLSSSVRLHRELLNVPVSSPFRQYTRLTVCVDSVAQATALNSGNPILKSYTLVAVKPLNQNAFEHACQVSEVDIIAIDFSEKLPYRLKFPMIKAAMQRGVYFEITYSNLIADVQTRRQVISNAKLLVDWTRGKNIIFSSAASSADELRGPYDVANLASLLGISMERAKAALSKNCRDLIAKALRKRQFYKETINVEPLSPGEQLDCKELSFAGWDPISSGEGDLLLDDLAKSFSKSTKASQTVKAIDFASIMDSIPSNGLHVKDLITGTKPLAVSGDSDKKYLPSAKVTEVSVETNVVPSQPRSNETFLIDTPLSNQQASVAEELQNSILTGSTLEIHPMKESTNNATTVGEEGKNSNDLDSCFCPSEKEVHFGSQSQNLSDETFQTTGMNIDFDAAHNADVSASSLGNQFNFQHQDIERSKSSDAVLSAEYVDVDRRNQAEVLFPLSNVSLRSSDAVLGIENVEGSEDVKLDEQNEEVFLPSSNASLQSSDAVLGAEDVEVDKQNQAEVSLPLSNLPLQRCDAVLGAENAEVDKQNQTEVLLPLTIEIDGKNQAELSLSSSSVCLPNFDLFLGKIKDLQDEDSADNISLEPCVKRKVESRPSVVDHELKEVTMEDQNLGVCTETHNPAVNESSTGKSRGKQRTPNRGVVFPLKRLLHPVPFKKKARRSKVKSKML